MIALILLITLAIWLVIVIFLCVRIPTWFGASRNKKWICFLLFPIIFILPFVDEFIGRWQFDRLCERESVAILNPDWIEVKAASIKSLPRERLKGFAFPIYRMVTEYSDVETGEVFLKTSPFLTYGGFVFRVLLGFNSQGHFCLGDISKIKVEIKLDKLLEQGRIK